MTRFRARFMRADMIAAMLPGAAQAQFTPQPPAGAPNAVQNRWPEPPKPMEAAPAPSSAPAPSPKAAGKRPPTATEAPAASKPAAHAKVMHPSGSAVSCSGIFAKDSSHMKLATKYDSRNVVFGQVDGPDGTKIPASILFPNDPKRRLEVLWADDAARSGTSVIAINGKSQWGAPKGLKLGLSVQAVEKLNGKSFKLSGFGADGSASVLSWEGGALASLPGGCKVGVRLLENGKASEEARNSVAGDKELMSNDTQVRAVNPSVTEILIGY